MVNWRFVGCKLLAILAWLTATAWFLVAYAATWGFIPIAMGYWSVVALPVAALTGRWLRRLGHSVPSRAQRWTMIAWVCLLLMLLPLLVGGDYPLWDYVWILVFSVYLVFPLVVTAWALRTIIRASSLVPSSGLTTR